MCRTSKQITRKQLTAPLLLFRCCLIVELLPGELVSDLSHFCHPLLINGQKFVFFPRSSTAQVDLGIMKLHFAGAQLFAQRYETLAHEYSRLSERSSFHLLPLPP